MDDDSELLRRYADTSSEPAFAEFVGRQLNFVYGTALRQVGGDAHFAADICQYVFSVVARQAGPLARHRALKGWLYTTTRRRCANLVRGERRRQLREQEALFVQTIDHSTPDESPAALRPLLDQALAGLREGERELLLLRYFEDLGYEEIGARCALSADAARLKSGRALEKMRSVLARRGVASTAGALATALAAEASVVAPGGLGASITSMALSGPITGGWLFFLTSNRLQWGVAGALVAGLIGSVLLQDTRADLNRELEVLRRPSGARALVGQVLTATPPIRTDPVRRGEIAGLQREVALLQEALAASPLIPLRPGMVPMTAWKNLGRDTPLEAMETLLWSVENAEIGMVARGIGFATPIRTQMEEELIDMPPELRAVSAVSTPEEAAGFAWIFGAQLAGAQVLNARTSAEDPNVVSLLVLMQKRAGWTAPQKFDFRRTPEGWRWEISGENFDFLGRGVSTYLEVTGSLP